MNLSKAKSLHKKFSRQTTEWLVLTSGILRDNDIVKILQAPENFIESKEYFSWERYFTALLIEKTSGTHLNYTKKTLNQAYLNDGVKRAILNQMDQVELE